MLQQNPNDAQEYFEMNSSQKSFSLRRVTSEIRIQQVPREGLMLNQKTIEERKKIDVDKKKLRQASTL